MNGTPGHTIRGMAATKSSNLGNVPVAFESRDFIGQPQRLARARLQHYAGHSAGAAETRGAALGPSSHSPQAAGLQDLLQQDIPDSCLDLEDLSTLAATFGWFIKWTYPDLAWRYCLFLEQAEPRGPRLCQLPCGLAPSLAGLFFRFGFYVSALTVQP